MVINYTDDDTTDKTDSSQTKPNATRRQQLETSKTNFN